MDFFEVVESRRSVRAFKPQPIEPEKLEQLLEAVNRAPSAGNLQAYEVVRVEDKLNKEKLVEACHHQDFLSEAPLILVFCANPERNTAKYGERGETLYALQDATIAAAYAQLAAHALGLASVWVGAFEEGAVLEILRCPAEWIPVAVMPIGYANEKPFLMDRRIVDEVFHRWGL